MDHSPQKHYPKCVSCRNTLPFNWDGDVCKKCSAHTEAERISILEEKIIELEQRLFFLEP